MFKILIKSQSPAEELDHLAFKTRQFSAAVKAALKNETKANVASANRHIGKVLFTSFHFRQKSTCTRSQRKLHFLRMSTRQKIQDGAHVLQFIGSLSFNG